jgi:hypothetical protein
METRASHEQKMSLNRVLFGTFVTTLEPQRKSVAETPSISTVRRSFAMVPRLPDNVVEQGNVELDQRRCSSGETDAERRARYRHLGGESSATRPN